MGAAVSTLQIVLERLCRITFPHGPEHHVAIEIHGEDLTELLADVLYKCESLNEVRYLASDLREGRVLGDDNETVVYFPRTTWVQP
jgi:hypothetical protein